MSETNNSNPKPKTTNTEPGRLTPAIQRGDNMKTEIRCLTILAVTLTVCAAFMPARSSHAQDVGTIDVPTMVAVTSGIDGPDARQHVAEKAPDYVGVDLLAQWEGDTSPKISRFHDRQSGVEFICVSDRSCVLTGRKWSDSTPNSKTSGKRPRTWASNSIGCQPRKPLTSSGSSMGR